MDLNFPGDAMIVISSNGYGKVFVTDVNAEKTVEFTLDPEWWDQDYIPSLARAMRELDHNLV